MIFKEFYENFNITFHNEPIKFSETIKGDGKTYDFKLNFYPLSDYEPYLPQVYIDNVLKTEGVDYTVDYREAAITFNEPPDNNSEILVNGFHQKFNLLDVVNSYNRSLEFLEQVFPLKKYIKIDYNDVPGAKESDTITMLDLSIGKFKDIREIYGIYQNIDDIRPIPFEQRGNIIMFKMGNDDFVVGDYHGFRKTKRLSNIYNSLSYPFYIHCVQKYKKIDITYPLRNVLNTYIEVEDIAYEQLLLLVGILCYEGRIYYNERIQSYSLRRQTLADIQNTIKILNSKLVQDLQFKAIGKGFFQDTSPNSIIPNN